MESKGAVAFSVGECVFFDDTVHSWTYGKVSAVQQKLVDCKSITGSLNPHISGVITPSIAPSNLYTVHNPEILEENTDDLLTLSELHECTVSHVLRKRFFDDCIYTHIGSILIAINPFNFDIPWYVNNRQNSERYLALSPDVPCIPLLPCSGATSAQRYEQEVLFPHVWSQAHSAYHGMRYGQRPQTVLVSGESGAGKTEATKMITWHLAIMSKRYGLASPVLSSDVTSSGRLVGGDVPRLLSVASPLLEAFGNARTQRNHNSSRFGKFLVLQFDSQTRSSLLGALTKTFLLEKSRVLTCGLKEQCYHAFYQLLLSAPAGMRAKMFLTGDPLSYKHLFAGNVTVQECLDISGGSDLSFAASEEAMQALGFTAESVDAVWRTVAAVIHLACVDIVPCVGSDDDSGAMVSKGSQDHLSAAAQLLGLSAEDMVKRFSTSTFVRMGETIVKKHNPSASAANRDSFAKQLYAMLFDWLVMLVNRSNAACQIDEDSGNHSEGFTEHSPQCCSTQSATVAVLDIFGFECFDTVPNSFEQLCINLANETLQNHYNKQVYEKDLAECAADGIDTTSFVSPSNDDTLALLSGKLGIFSLLDEVSGLDYGTDESFLSRITDEFGNKAGGSGPTASPPSSPRKDKPSIVPLCTPSSRFYRGPRDRDSFTVRHYAEAVQYTIGTFVDKNKDYVKPDLQDLLSMTNLPFASAAASASDALSSPGRKPKLKTLGGLFRQQMGELMTQIESTQPSWVRCIKPCMARPAPKTWHGSFVSRQLHSAGVLETIRIRKAGYPIRIPLIDFYERFRIVFGLRKLPSPPPDLIDIREILRRALLDLDPPVASPEDGQVGRTKMFLRMHAYTRLEDLKRLSMQKYAIVTQVFARSLVSQYVVKATAWRKHRELMEWIERVRDQRSQFCTLESSERTLLTDEEKKCRDSIVETFLNEKRALDALFLKAQEGRAELVTGEMRERAIIDSHQQFSFIVFKCQFFSGSKMIAYLVAAVKISFTAYVGSYHALWKSYFADYLSQLSELRSDVSRWHQLHQRYCALVKDVFTDVGATMLSKRRLLYDALRDSERFERNQLGKFLTVIMQCMLQELEKTRRTAIIAEFIASTKMLQREFVASRQRARLAQQQFAQAREKTLRKRAALRTQRIEAQEMQIKEREIREKVLTSTERSIADRCQRARLGASRQSSVSSTLAARTTEESLSIAISDQEHHRRLCESAIRRHVLLLERKETLASKSVDSQLILKMKKCRDLEIERRRESALQLWEYERQCSIHAKSMEQLACNALLAKKRRELAQRASLPEADEETKRIADSAADSRDLLDEYSEKIIQKESQKAKRHEKLREANIQAARNSVDGAILDVQELTKLSMRRNHEITSQETKSFKSHRVQYAMISSVKSLDPRDDLEKHLISSTHSPPRSTLLSSRESHREVCPQVMMVSNPKSCLARIACTMIDDAVASPLTVGEARFSAVDDPGFSSPERPSPAKPKLKPRSGRISDDAYARLLGTESRARFMHDPVIMEAMVSTLPRGAPAKELYEAQLAFERSK